MSNTGIILYRGTSQVEGPADVKSCWTEDREAAESYGAHIAEWHLDVSAVCVVDAPAYDRDADWAPGDTSADCAAWAAQGADLIRYEDEDCNGQPCTTYRVVRAGLRG